jgi:hypothetical protein
LLDDPNTGAVPPSVDARGAYTAAAGGTVRLDATASGGAGELVYRWDLDGDGLFDDAEGAAPVVSAGPTGRRLLALEVTDASGQRTFAYASLTVDQDAAAPVPVTTPPAPSVQTVGLGQQLDFKVNSGQPTQWMLDGAPVASGAAYRYAPTRLADVGAHLVSALVGETSRRRARLDWLVMGGRRRHRRGRLERQCRLRRYPRRDQPRPGRDRR